MHVFGRRVTRAGLGTACMEADLVQFEESDLLGQLVQQSGQLRKLVAIFSSAGFIEHFAQAIDICLRCAGPLRSTTNYSYRVEVLGRVRNVLVRDYVAGTRDRIAVERLPAYAPELNPVEYMWGHLKNHQISNLLMTKA